VRSAGCGKTLLALEFLIGHHRARRARRFVAFEESTTTSSPTSRRWGFDLARHVATGTLVLDHIEVAGRAVEETGDWDLDGSSSGSAPPSTPSGRSGW
jgi:KaiC/GvpD/RAD55 family RecA-like ATPase